MLEEVGTGRNGHQEEKMVDMKLEVWIEDSQAKALCVCVGAGGGEALLQVKGMAWVKTKGG
jgi:hypothetical protein